MDDSNLMLDYLKTFDLYNVDIQYYDIHHDSGATSSKIKLALSTKIKYIPKERITSFLIFSSFFDTFLIRDINTIYDEIKAKIYKKGSDEYANERTLINDVISQYFYNYVKEYEVEIYCELERAKSPFYTHKYEAELNNLKPLSSNYVVSKVKNKNSFC